MNILLKLFTIFVLGTNFLASLTVDPVDYFKSFVLRREFSTVGRHAGGYHTYFLEDTARSLEHLETQLATDGFSLNKRMVIMGYERNALPSYFTCYRHCTGDIINDELLVKTASGWTVPLHNKFGLMTGFLLRKAHRIENELAPETIFEHVNPQRVEIFHEMMDSFQEDSFGTTLYHLLKNTEEAVLPAIKAGDVKTFLEYAQGFWNFLYKKGECTGDAQVAGTQDILFSIAHAKYLKTSRTPIKKFFTGGDVTYPINPTTRCNKNATKNSQDFAMHFVNYLTPQNGKKTVYIFNSFVDGVGKSTMLGNIKNYMKHGKDLDAYEKTDNTSSQTADVWEYAPDVFIADLPAQVSHFMIKPDGNVYIHVDASHIDQDLAVRARQYAENNVPMIKEAYDALIRQARNNSWSRDVLNDNAHPERAFAQNLVLLKKDTKNPWVPFAFEGHHFVYDHLYTHGLRVLLPIKDAESEGLKTIEAEQMIFTEGVRFPMPYQIFLNDLKKQLKDRGVEEVVFVDFLSMYSRSSRENIRVNYLLQQMALLDKQFDQEKTLYRYFVTNAELFGLVRKKENRSAFGLSLALEAQIRWALHEIMVTSTDVTLSGVDLLTLKERIEKLVKGLDPATKEKLAALVEKKVSIEAAGLELQYGLAKEFINVELFDFSEAEAYSDFIIDLCSKKIENPVFEKLWSNFASPLATSLPSSVGDGPVPEDKALLTLTTGETVRALYVFGAECRSGIVLAPGLRALRAAWYTVLSNLIDAKKNGDQFEVKKPRAVAPPIALKKGPDGRFYVVIKAGEFVKAPSFSIDPIWKLGKSEKLTWIYYDGIFCPLAPRNFATDEGVYGFGPQKTSSYGTQQETVFPQFDFWYYWQGVAKLQEKYGHDNVIPTSLFYRIVTENRHINVTDSGALKHKVRENMEELEKKRETDVGKSELAQLVQDKAFEEKDEFFQASVYNKRRDGGDLRPVPERSYEAARFAVRALATLESIIKDPAGNIALRSDNQEDFECALKIFESIVIPQYFRLVFMEPLFSNYAAERGVL